jgi:DNA-binding GntR family transcriptional regulator
MTEERTVLASSVYEALKEFIMDQVAPPGARLNIDNLAAELKVSPTPVREALARLAAERLVTFEPYKGYRVSPLLTAAQVVDLMHVRLLLEVDAARLAARRIRLPDLITVEKNLHASLEAGGGSWSHGYRQFNQLDQTFHETLIAAADNRFLLEAYRALNIHVELGRFYSVFAELDQRETCAEHQAVYQALRAHDAEAAAVAIEAHLNATRARILHFFDQTRPDVSASNGYHSERRPINN